MKPCPFHEPLTNAKCAKVDYLIEVYGNASCILRRRYWVCEKNSNHTFDQENQIWNDGKGVWLTEKQAEILQRLNLTRLEKRLQEI